MSIEQSAERRRAIQTQRGRKIPSGTARPKWHSALERRRLIPAL